MKINSENPASAADPQRSQNIVLVLTIAYFFVELFGGLRFRSLALVTDASFMAINISGQLIAIYVGRLAGRAPDEDNTFGYERAKVLSGLFNGILVGFLLFYVVINAYQRILRPEQVEAGKVLVVAILGLLVNAFGLIKLGPHSGDINVRGSRLLILNDTLGSLGVIASAGIIRFTGLYFVDPVTAVAVGMLTAYPTYFLIRESVHILMEGKPAHIAGNEVRTFIYDNFPGVAAVKDMHIWGLTPEKTILVVRVRTDQPTSARQTVRTMKALLKKNFVFSDVFIELYEREEEGLRMDRDMPGGMAKTAAS